ncbi:MAG: folylpolyglutamate synthase/dihydrofolate synthase family protein [Oscillospiraceae bacterium]
MTYDETLEFIHSQPRMKKTDEHRALKLLLKYLGAPQDKLKYVHIAGTNGKGSCAKMLSNVLAQAGYKTGLNISPFVIDFTERISINGEYIPQQALCEIAQRIKTLQEKMNAETELRLAEFEIVTAIAFYYFAQEKCDIVCLEVGIGGLLDSTNVIKDSVISCIMNVSYDHMEILGDTIEKIAFQKAGIIKENQRVICYPAMDEKALQVINEVAKSKNSTVVLPQIAEIHCTKVSRLKTQLEYGNYKINQAFTGRHQGYNAAVVIEGARALRQAGYNIPDDAIVRGIEGATFPARIEIISEEPLVILDGAHNLDGISALINVLKENDIHNLTAVWASLGDKEPEKIIQLMAPFIENLFTVELHGARAVPRDKLAQMAKKYITNVKMADTVEQGIKMAKETATDGVLVFGSLYLASDAREFLI